MKRTKKAQKAEKLATVSLFWHTAGAAVALVSTVAGAILGFWSIGDTQAVRSVLAKTGSELTSSIILTSIGTLSVAVLILKSLSLELTMYFRKTRDLGNTTLEDHDKKVVVDQ